jgi:hypothetical protein
MNIFVLHKDPVIAAQMLCDKHICKMGVEAGQMLCTAWQQHCPNIFDNIYRPTHKHHPCTKWAGQTRSNFTWLLDHATAILDEYDHVRFGITGNYSRLRTVLARCKRFINVIPDGQLTPFVLAMPEKYKQIDSVQAYRAYYIAEKAGFARWNNNRPPPYWWVNTSTLVKA